MASTYTKLGTIGPPPIIEKTFWFSNSERRSSQIDVTFSVPNGNYLFTWNGLVRGDYNRTGTVIVNGVSSGTLRSISGYEAFLGGYMKLSTTSSIRITGTGTLRFIADPKILLIRV